MKHNLYIEVDDNNNKLCGKNCPFRDQWSDGSTCTLFGNNCLDDVKLKENEFLNEGVFPDTYRCVACFTMF